VLARAGSALRLAAARDSLAGPLSALDSEAVDGIYERSRDGVHRMQSLTKRWRQIEDRPMAAVVPGAASTVWLPPPASSAGLAGLALLTPRNDQRSHLGRG
jgi:hypothetical protein